MRHVCLMAMLFGLAACSGPDAPKSPAMPTESAPVVEAAAATATSPVAGPGNNNREAADIVNRYCLTCHGRGLYNAPKIGDAEAWQIKLVEGREHLWQVVLHGEKAMPPRGNCHECSDDELRAAMDYLIAQSVPGAD